MATHIDLTFVKDDKFVNQVKALRLIADKYTRSEKTQRKREPNTCYYFFIQNNGR